MPLHSALAKLPARLLSWLRSYSSMVTLSPEKLDLCVYPLCQGLYTSAGSNKDRDKDPDLRGCLDLT